MKHLKLFFALFAMLALGVRNAWGAEAKFGTDWNSVFGTSYSGTISSVKANQLTLSGTVNSVSLVATNGTSTNGYVKTGDWRLYNGYTLTLTAPANHNITAISAKKGGKAIAGISTTVGDLSIPSGGATMSWTGSSNQVVFKVTTTMGFSEITVTYSEGSGSTPEPEPDPDPTPEPEEPETPGTGGEETWTLVTNASDLKAGDQIVIAATGSAFALGPQASNNRTAVAITKTGNNITWTTDVQIITLETGNKANTFAFNTGGGYLYAVSSSDNHLRTKTTLDDNGSWAISITPEGVATIKAQGTSTRNWIRKNSSSALFSCYGSGQSDVAIYKKVTSSGGGEPETPTPSVSVTPPSHTFTTTNVGETATQEFTIKAENTTETLSAEISNTTDYAISAIADNKITVTYQPQTAETHEATLTIKAGDEASATVTLSGKAVTALEGTWVLVTDASSLNVGDKIIIAAKESDVALSTTQNSNNRAAVTVTKNGNQVIATSETQVLTLQSGNKNNTLALYTGSGYLYAASSSSNHLKTENTLSDNSSWNITITNDGVASLVAQGEYTRNVMRYNPNTGSGNPLFACYAADKAADQKDLALYKNTNGKQLAGLAYATTKYLTKVGDAFTTPTLTNPNSLTVTYSSSDNNVATVDNTGTVTIKAAGVVVITAAFAGDASYLEGSAKYTLCVTEHAGTEADPYSVADARRVIDVMETAEGVYATGIVSEIVTAYNATYGNITYNISIDGTTVADQLQAYRGKGVNGENFSSANDIKVGDEVVVKGNLKKHETTYEFDANNQLVSLKREKQQAGLAYEEKEHTANVGEDFTEPTLTNPNSLTVTYSSSNTALATVDATTGEVSILAAGKVTITASSAADATYAAGSASYNITITDPSLAVATLPFYFDGKRADIEGTAGMTQSNLGTDYAAAPYLKFNAEGAWAIVQFDSEPGEFSFLLKQNGESIGTFTVYESENGEDYTPIWSGGDLGGNAKSATIEPTLSATARYVKFEYTTKPTGTNYGLGEISIKKADHRQEAGLAWNPATVSLTVGDAFTPPTFSKPNSVSVTDIEFTSSNPELATVTNAGAISLLSGKTGTATITATFAGDATYKAAEVTCVITVSPKTENVVILAQYAGNWYALMAQGAVVDGLTKTDRLAALPVAYFNGTLYNVEDADKALITWERVVTGDKATFKNGENYISGTAGSTDLKLATTECEWTYDGSSYMIGNRTFLYRAQANGFKNYNAEDNAGTADYSSLPVVTAPVYGTGTITQMDNLTPQMYGTICLENNVVGYEGITFYEVAGKEGNKVIFDEVTELEAGMPYIYIADSETATIVIGEETALSASKHKSLQGTFTQIDPAESNILTGNYILYNNVIKMCGKNCGLKDHKAYFIADELGSLSAPQAQMPGRRRVSLNTTGENAATGIGDVVVPTEQVTKAIINGQLIIIRDGEMYNAQGQRL